MEAGIRSQRVACSEDCETAPGHLAGLAPVYFTRKLRIVEDALEGEILDSELLALGRSVVVLGEPGMGKSELIRELGRVSGMAPVSAPRFMQSKDARAFVRDGKPLLIDGLDEAISRAENDALDRVLAQLEDAGCPTFILSCRSREWQSRSLRSLAETYGAEPLVVSIEELTREESSAFWSSRGFKSAVEPILDDLDAQGLSDLYRNPLTLGLLGRVADSRKPLPSTRAELFGHVCELTWREEDQGRQSTRLAQITQEQALSSAGAIMAGMILGGAEAIGLGGLAEVQEGEIWIGDLERLPGADEARAVIASKLFRSVGVGRAAPIHRVVAEYLGARWLDAQATTSRARRRLLAQFQGGGAVPSSLRGLHAWLAFHSPHLSKDVIAADPFGLLRYGETALLSGMQAGALLDSLEILARADPYFRAQDWDARSAKGLAQPAIAPRIDAILANAGSNLHLRTLLLESIKDTPLAASLSATLERIILDARRYYGEREEALAAVFAVRDRPFWLKTIQALVDDAREDSARLAGRIVEMVDYEVTDELVASVLLAEIGLQVSVFPRTKQRGSIRFRHFEKLVSALSPARAKALLSILSVRVPPKAIEDHDSRRDFSELVALLLLHAIRGAVIGVRAAPSVWLWLGQINEWDSANKERLIQVRDAFKKLDNLRREVQRYGIWTAGKSRTLWHSEYHLNRRAIGLAGNVHDIAYFLKMVAKKRLRTRRARSDWKDLVMLGIWTDRDTEEVLAAARIFPGFGQKERAVIRRAIHPPKPQWKIRQEEMDAEWDAQEKEEHRLAVASFMAIIPQIRTGDINGTYNPARVYLGLHLSGRGNTSKSSEERLAWFFNEALAKEFLVGFEATLHRSDLPSLSEISDSHSNGKIWNVSYPLIAGLLERQLSGRGFAEIATDTLRKALLICAQQRQGIGPDKDITELRMALEHAVSPKVEDKQALLRYWVEPYLNSGPSPHQELQGIEHIPLWCEAVASLAREWLVRYSQMSLEAEMELANALARAGDFVAIVEVARLRDLEVYRDEDHALAWLALDVVYRFDEIFINLSGVGRDHPELLWLLRDRMQTRRGGPVTGGGLQVGAWIVSEFRTVYPYATMSGVSVGTTNGFDATDFLKSLISRVSAHTSDDAAQLMVHLAAGPSDNYSAEIKHLAAEQLQKRAEESFSPIAPAGLTAILTAGAPTNIDDFRSLIV